MDDAPIIYLENEDGDKVEIPFEVTEHFQAYENRLMEFCTIPLYDKRQTTMKWFQEFCDYHAKELKHEIESKRNKTNRGFEQWAKNFLKDIPNQEFAELCDLAKLFGYKTLMKFSEDSYFSRGYSTDGIEEGDNTEVNKQYDDEDRKGN